MFYIFENGRVLGNQNMLRPEDEGKYVAVEELPLIEEIEGKQGYVSGCNLETGEIFIDYFDTTIEEPPLPPEPQPTEQDLLNAQILLNQAEQDAKLKEIDEALALILLNQEGGIENVL